MFFIKLPPRIFRFNSTLVQLKVVPVKVVFLATSSFNSTLVQLKVNARDVVDLTKKSFNSTLVQLKDASEALNSLLI